MSAHFEESQFLSHCLPICNRGANFFYNAAYPGIAEGNPVESLPFSFPKKNIDIFALLSIQQKTVCG